MKFYVLCYANPFALSADLANLDGALEHSEDFLLYPNLQIRGLCM